MTRVMRKQFPGSGGEGYRGRLANDVPPVMELPGLVELEHNPRNNRVRAIDPQ
jgi:hypothetical protein